MGCYGQSICLNNPIILYCRGYYGKLYYGILDFCMAANLGDVVCRVIYLLVD